MDSEHTTAVDVGELAPDFQLAASTGREIALADYRDRSPSCFSLCVPISECIAQ